MDAADGDWGGGVDEPVCCGNEGAVDAGVAGGIDDGGCAGIGDALVVSVEVDIVGAGTDGLAAGVVVAGDGDGLAAPPAAAAYLIGGNTGFTGAFDCGKPAFSADDMGCAAKFGVGTGGFGGSTFSTCLRGTELGCFFATGLNGGSSCVDRVLSFVDRADGTSAEINDCSSSE